MQIVILLSLFMASFCAWGDEYRKRKQLHRYDGDSAVEDPLNTFVLPSVAETVPLPSAFNRIGRRVGFCDVKDADELKAHSSQIRPPGTPAAGVGVLFRLSDDEDEALGALARKVEEEEETLARLARSRRLCPPRTRRVFHTTMVVLPVLNLEKLALSGAGRELMRVREEHK